jgi:hypothetical protein
MEIDFKMNVMIDGISLIMLVFMILCMVVRRTTS